MTKQLVWYGPPYSYSGYAQHNRAMLFELHKRGWEIYLIPTEKHIPAGLIGQDILKSMTLNKHINPKQNIVLNLIPPPALPFYGKHTILFTTLESKTVHEGYLRRCKLFDELWFPCLDNIKSFRAIGYPKKKLTYCPEGVYHDFWTPYGEMNKEYKNNKFTFFFNGDWSYRKGIDILINAYVKTFDSSDNVRLLMLTHYQGNDQIVSKFRISQELDQFLSKIGKRNVPEIQFIFTYLDDKDMPELFRSADVYVCPTRGEAWCLPIIQAMSCGVPAITSSWGGQTDFCNTSNSLMIKTDKFDTIHDKCDLHVDFYWYQKFCFPSEDHLSRLMKFAYNNPSYMRKLGERARKDVSTNFGWDKSGYIADRRLTKIYESRNFTSNV